MSQERQLSTVSGRAIQVAEDHSAIGHLFDTARFEHMFRIAKAMAQATLIPEHLWRDKQGPFDPDQVVGNCFLIVNQAVRWGMDPFAVAPETYCVSGKLGFQGKLVAAVVNARAGLKERLSYSFTGQGDALTVTVSGTFEGEATPRTATLTVKDARTSNDMWRKDPEQKLIYSGATKWARRHCPEVLLGVLTDDDVERFAEARALANVDFEDPKAREFHLAALNREATEEYNERLRAQGVPEDQLESLPPMPEAPDDGDQIPGIERRDPAQKAEVPWQETAVTNFKNLQGKKLGDLTFPVLEKIRDTINGYSAAVRASKPGIDDLLSATLKGIKELEPVEEPPKATPLEGLRNLMQASGVTEKAVLAYILEQQGSSPGVFTNLQPEMAGALITAWPDIVDQIKGISK